MITKLKLFLTLASIVTLHSLSYGQAAGTPFISPNRNLTAVFFEYTGAIQPWTVPAGVTEIFVDVIGAQGGDIGTTEGGAGGRVRARLAVNAGDVYQITVGGKPASGTPELAVYGFGGQGGYSRFSADNSRNVGAAGGGLSGISTASPITQGNALVIAGGGGGAVFGSYQNAPTEPLIAHNGGAGGGTTGFTGSNSRNYYSGKGGTSTAGGAVGQPFSLSHLDVNTTQPTAGTVLTGGNGGIVDPNNVNTWYGGGGGGAGYYGGGGGLAGAVYRGAGGGGSSWTAPAATGVAHIGNFNKGNGRVIIRY